MSDRASKRAKERAAAKASRAAAAGISLPTIRRKRGWAVLRQKLKAGTLVSSIKGVPPRETSKRKQSATVRRSSISAIKHHLADIAYRISHKRTSAISGADSRLIALHTKQAQELTARKREERDARRKLIRKQKKLERELEYLNFPTIMGWYFDGFFTPYFQLNEEYAAIFNQQELEISKSKENAIKETFAEKAKRYFWPPDLCGNFCFRTRGIYLDFNEIMKDPPHTPPEIILDQRVEAVTLFVAPDMTELESRVPSDEEIANELSDQVNLAEVAAEEERMHELMKAIDDNPNMTEEDKAVRKKALLVAFKRKKQKSLMQQKVAAEMHFKAINKNDFYFDDQFPGFFKKKARDRDKYYYDSRWDVWRIKRTIICFPNDFYWDEQLAIFFPKDRTRPQDYYLYDPNLGAYRVAGEPMPPNWRGIKPSDFYFDHRVGKWVKKTKAPAGISPYLDNNGQRFCVNKTNDTPDDFYFDALAQQFEKKTDGKYIFDANFGAWRRVGAPMPGKGSLKPIDFYWNETEHTFTKKDAPSSFFAWDANNKFFRKKKSLHGKYHPKNWTWTEKKKMWELKKSSTRHNLMSQSLYWRPDRDYDKPWLEYVGGYRDYHIEYDYDVEDDEGIKLVGPGGKVLGKGDTDKAGSSGKGGKKLHFSTSEPIMKTGSATGGVSEEKDSKKDNQDVTSVAGSSAGTKSGIMKPGENSENLAFVDTLDRKTLKVTNLGSMVTDTDLRKYFASVKKIVRPTKPGTEFEEDYAYLKFKTDEAAAVALKTMHNQQIRGVIIKLQYKLKSEDETRGGQRDVTPQQPTLL